MFWQIRKGESIFHLVSSQNTERSPPFGICQEGAFCMNERPQNGEVKAAKAMWYIWRQLLRGYSIRIDEDKAVAPIYSRMWLA